MSQAKQRQSEAKSRMATEMRSKESDGEAGHGQEKQWNSTGKQGRECNGLD